MRVDRSGPRPQGAGEVGGLRADLPLPADQVVDVLPGALASVEGRCLIGVHVCGPADWRLVLQAGPGLLSLPVGDRQERAENRDRDDGARG